MVKQTIFRLFRDAASDAILTAIDRYLWPALLLLTGALGFGVYLGLDRIGTEFEITVGGAAVVAVAAVGLLYFLVVRPFVSALESAL
jgi:hypothetical protein